MQLNRCTTVIIIIINSVDLRNKLTVNTYYLVYS